MITRMILVPNFSAYVIMMNVQEQVLPLGIILWMLLANESRRYMAGRIHKMIPAIN